MTWQEQLKGDPLTWLLEPESPGVRYLAMRDLLEDQGFQVTTQIDDAATTVQLGIDFISLDGATTIDDLFVFYFSGHGGQTAPGTNGGTESTPNSDSEEEFIALYDTDLIDDELADLVRGVFCVRKVVILDACYSGGFIGNSLEADTIPPNYSENGSNGLFATLSDAIYLYANFQDYGSDIPPAEALVIAASGEQDVAYETDGNGVMTRYLLESATQADLNFDRCITVSESYFYIYRNIVKHFNTVYGASGHAFFPDVSGGPVDYVLFTK